MTFLFKEMTIEESFYIGYITKTKGLKGEVQVYFECDDYEELDFESVFVEINKKLIPYFISSYKIHPNSTGYFYFEDVDVIEKAAKLLKKKLYLPLSKKPERTDDAFYYTDLKGFIAYDEKLGELGEILDVHEYPQQFIAVVSYQSNEIMFPLNDDLIVSIDEEERTLHVDLPDGLTDIYLS